MTRQPPRAKAGGGGKKKRRPPLGQWVKAQCENMRRHLLARRRVTDLQLAEVWPSKRAPTEEWVRCYGTLRAWVYDEAEAQTAKGMAEEQLLAALREEPIRITLLDGTTADVHPKGLDALLWLRARSWFTEWLAARLEALREAAANGTLERSGVPEPVGTMERIERELAYQLGAIAAVATTAGPGGASYMEPGADVPERWTDMNPIDLFRVHKAFMEVNAARLDALSRIVRPTKPGESGADRMSWNVFLSTLAMRLNEDPAKLARERSLVSLLATVRLAKESEPELKD